MTTVTAQESGRYTFPHGVHPPENKSLAEEAAIEVVATPKQVELPVLQHIGAPSKSTLKPRSEVTLGQEVLEAGGFVSAPAHAPIAGKTAKATLCTLPSGRHLECIPIKAAGEQLEGQALYDDVLGGDWPYAETQRLASEEIFARIQGAGIVGLGGAAFPTHVKFAKNEDKPIRTIVVNGCECEPYLTADDRLMREAPAPVIAGALLAARSAGAQEVVIGVEDNKPQAIATLREQAEKAAGTGVPVRVAVLKSKYPQGGERQLIRALLRLEVPTGGLPLDVGVVVINVGTASAIARAVLRGKPLTHRVVSVTGRGIAQPKNLLVPIGISYQALIDHCGGLRPDAARVVSGGPMMGFTVSDLSTPVTKGTSGITVLTRDEVKKPQETNCLRCGRCVDVCPVGLVPTKIALAARHRNWGQAKRYWIGACIECGSCAYECPASIPLVQLIRMGKWLLPKE
jgi:electron transport complex protein RnfC